MSTDEAALLAAVRAEPRRPDARLVLADWLDDRADPRGELLRLTLELVAAVQVSGRPVKEARLRELLAAGVRPCVPAFTNAAGVEMVLVPPGTFRMGSPFDEPGRYGDETPHPVTLTRAFYLGRFHVTQAEYERVVGRNPSAATPGSLGLDTARFPVENVTFGDALAFCAALSALPEERAAGRVYRLPTEAEWEYACRAGTTTPYNTGETLAADRANFHCGKPLREGDETSAGTPLGRPCPVGRYPPNAFGLSDMHGNVDQWCADVFGLYPESACVDPEGPPAPADAYEEPERCIRGSSFEDGARVCRSAFRFSTVPDFAHARTGFRVACTAADD